jgi:uncharacterized membrane protein YvbJ
MEKLICTHCGTENKTKSNYCYNCGYKLPQINNNLNVALVQPITKKSNKNIIIWGIIISIIVLGLSFFGIQQIFFKPPYIEKLMMITASELNKTCPIMVDKYTRLDNAVAMPDNSFQYNYTLVTLTKAEVNIDTARKYIEPGIINNIKTNPDLKYYRDNKITMIYSYRDKNGEFVMKFSETPDKYK